MSLLAVAAMLLANPPGASPDPKSLEATPAELQKAQELVRKLASPAFTERDAANRELKNMGRLALSTLTRAVEESNDPEVRIRCENLIPSAATDDFNAKLATFLADQEGKFEHHLPGWDKFQKLTGKDPEARGLFAELLKSEPNRELIAGLAHDEAELTRRVITRRTSLYEQMYPRTGTANRYDPTLLDAAGLLFCESLIGDKGSPRGFIRAITPYTMLLRSSVLNSLDSDRYGPVVRKLIIAWLDTRESPTSLSQAATLASRLDLKDGTKYAIRMLQAQGATPLQRATAATTLARIGTKNDAKHLIPLMTEETVVRAANGGQGEIQVRDIALAMAAHLMGHDPAHLGLTSNTISDAARFYYWNYSFGNAAERDAGFSRWAKLEPSLVPEKPVKKK